MNVGELMAALEKHDKGLEVWSEGCDCWGDVVKVVARAGGVLLERER